MKADLAAALKRTLLRDLGVDWVAPFVSVVDEPAVPKAKFFALKARALGSMEWAKQQISASLGAGRWVVSLFPVTVIVEQEDGSLFEYPWSIEGDEVRLGDPIGVEISYVQKQKATRGDPWLVGRDVHGRRAR